jgi:rod shape determining protein RodA
MSRSETDVKSYEYYNKKDKLPLRNLNFRLIIWVMLLNITGILVIRSAANGERYLVEKEIAGVCAGVVVMGLTTYFSYRKICRLSPLIYAGCAAILALVLILGRGRGITRRWIVVPFLGQLQPSEFVKTAIIIFFADYIGDRQDKIDDIRTLLLTAGLGGFLLLLIFLEPDLSTTIVIFICIVCMVFAAGLSYKWIVRILAVVVPAGGGFLFLLENNVIPFIQEYQAKRILAFFNKERYADANIQQDNSIMAIASGQLTGKGLNNNTLASVKNGNFLAEEHTDFIFAVLGEELGFIGCVVVIILYTLIVYECLLMAHKASDMTGKLLCTGVGVMIGFQAFTNIAVATGIFPNTGLPLPFISYGVSSLLGMYLGIGMVLSVGLRRDEEIDRRFS